MSLVKEKSSMMNNGTSDRLYYFDCLRVFALVMVIVVHAAAQKWFAVDVRSFEWNVFNLYDGLARGGSALFVMVSGALFLEKERPLRTICSKHLLRVVIAFAFWSAVYTFFDRANGVYTLYEKGPEASWFQQFMWGHYHMWFLYMIAGMYLLVPLLRRIVETKAAMNHFLLLALVFAVAIPQLVFAIGLCSEEWGTFAGEIFKKLQVHLVMGFTGLFVLGYFLNRAALSGRAERAVYLFGLLGAIATVLLTLAMSFHRGEPEVTFYGTFTFNVLIKYIAVYLFIREHCSLAGASDRLKRTVRTLSKYSFGAYLVHALVLEEMDRLLNFNTFSFNPLLSIPVIAAVTFVLSFAISGILNHIPVLRKIV